MLVNAAGQIEAQSGGFEINVGLRPGATTPGPPGRAGANRNVYIDANEDLDRQRARGDIALQNQVDQRRPTRSTTARARAPTPTPSSPARSPLTRCAITGVVACAPTGTNDANHFVVSPRLSDGGFTDNTNRKRFYVVITGDSSDYVAP